MTDGRTKAELLARVAWLERCVEGREARIVQLADRVAKLEGLSVAWKKFALRLVVQRDMSPTASDGAKAMAHTDGVLAGQEIERLQRELWPENEATEESRVESPRKETSWN